MKLAHRQYEVPKQESEGITGLKTTRIVKKKTRTNYDIEDIIEGLVVLGVSAIIINGVVDAVNNKKGNASALLVKKPT
jgi:hypothetical protein